jgi:hypothetical protein
MLTAPRPIVAVLAVALLALAACGTAGPPPAQGALVSVERRGGECPGGPCESLIVIERDGRVHQVKPQAAELGWMGAENRNALDGAIRVTDFAVLRSRPFTGECPIAFDGQEVIYTFGAPGGPQRIASCEVAIDPSNPLFLIVESQMSVGGGGTDGTDGTDEHAPIAP